jgi:crotonobetainyl-CoA:carnitine CoA-transferase CaiB-like acyl-CoA transferase
MPGPLTGVRIVDLTTVIMGPYATQILADYGADLIKVEAPGGDVMRKSGPMRNPDMGHFFLTTNRNKRSVVIDLKQQAGRAALLDIARDCDALVYNIRPQAMARLGLSYEDLQAVNPRIIYVGAFGFSQRGPYAARPAYDDLIQGMSGIPWLAKQGGADKPRYAPMVLADRMVGLQLAGAVTAALFHRERTGKGQRVDVPMWETMLSLVMGEHLAGHLFQPPTAPYGYQRSLAYDRRPYETSDGYICVLVYNDKHWCSFFNVIGKPDIFKTDHRFQSQGARLENIAYVYGFLSDTLKARTTAEWLQLLEHADVPASRMYEIGDMLEDEHLRATGFLRQTEHPTEGAMLDLAIPTEWSDSAPQHRYPAPSLGQHTVEVLREAGYTEEEISHLEAAGVITSLKPSGSLD